MSIIILDIKRKKAQGFNDIKDFKNALVKNDMTIWQVRRGLQIANESSEALADSTKNAEFKKLDEDDNRDIRIMVTRDDTKFIAVHYRSTMNDDFEMRSFVEFEVGRDAETLEHNIIENNGFAKHLTFDNLDDLMLRKDDVGMKDLAIRGNRFTIIPVK